MTISTKTTIKSYFETGDYPTQSQFSDFIDSCVFQAETSSQSISSLNITGMLSANNINAVTVSAATIAANTLTGTTATITNLTVSNNIAVSNNISVSGLSVFSTVSAATVYGTTIIPTNITGTPTNNDASTGSIGEYLTSTGTTISLVNNTAKTITSLGLQAGDWDVGGAALLSLASTTTGNAFSAGISQVTNVLPGTLSYANLAATLTTAGNPACTLTAPVQRISLAASANVFMVAVASFAVSAATASAIIRARRVR